MRRKFTLIALTFSGCNRAPSQDILGSYFPSWMLCAVISIFLTTIIYYFFSKTGVDEFIPAKLLIYICLAISLSFILWLLWYGN